MVRQTAQPRGEEMEQEVQDGPAAAESAEIPPQPQTHQSSPSSPLLDPLAQFDWYHGSIPREEAQYRLEQNGANDG